MASHEYDNPCPNCGKDMRICNDSRPIDYITGSCYHCGYWYSAIDGYNDDLKVLNELRDDCLDLPPLKKLPKQKFRMFE